MQEIAPILKKEKFFITQIISYYSKCFFQNFHLQKCYTQKTKKIFKKNGKKYGKRDFDEIEFFLVVLSWKIDQNL